MYSIIIFVFVQIVKFQLELPNQSMFQASNIHFKLIMKNTRICLNLAELICEPSHLKRLNSRSSLEEDMKARNINGGKCAVVEEKDDIFFPAYEPLSAKCFVQKDALLYSCAGEVDGLVRLCSCRNFIPGQTALCRECV